MVRKKRTVFTRRKKGRAKPLVDPIDDYLTKLYTETSGGGSFGGVKPLLDEIKRENKYKIKRKRVEEFLSSRDEYTLHRPIINKFTTEKIVVGAINDYHQGDLIVLNSFSKDNDGYGYILCVIDCFSRFAWTVPMKTKTPAELIPALEKVYRNRDTPTTFVSDAGKEFTAKATHKWFCDHNVQFAIAYGTNKAMFVERFIRTLKGMLFRYMTFKSSHRYIDKLDEITLAYNSRYHRVLGMRPIDVNANNQKDLFYRMYGDPRNWHIRKWVNKYRLGETVRISRIKGKFERGFDESYSREIYKIHKILSTDPIQYKLVSLKNEILHGRFYENELIPVRMRENTAYPIDRIIAHRIVNGQRESLVRYLGWDKSADEWVKDKQLTDINR